MGRSRPLFLILVVLLAVLGYFVLTETQAPPDEPPSLTVPPAGAPGVPQP